MEEIRKRLYREHGENKSDESKVNESAARTKARKRSYQACRENKIDFTRV